MAESSRLGLGGLVLFLAVTAGGFLTRGWYVNACDGGNDCAIVVQFADPHLPELIDNLQKGDGFTRADSSGKLQPWAGSEPLYPLMVGYLRSQGDSSDRQLAWLQAGLGALSAGFLFLFGCVAFQSKLTGIVAGVLAAVHPFWVINTTALNDGTLAVFLMTAVLAFGVLGSQKLSMPASLLFGLALGGLALTRAALLPFAIVALLWFLRRAAAVGGGGRIAFVAFVGFAGPLAPWMVRNYLDFGDVYPIVDSTYRHLWIGNNPNATGGPIDDAPPMTVKNQAKEVFNEVKGNPTRTLWRRIEAGIGFLFGGDHVSRGVYYSTKANNLDWLKRPRDEPWFMDYAPFALYAALLGSLMLAALGWRWSYLYHNEALLLAVAAIWVPLPYVLGHADALAGPRLPFDAVLLGYSAYALTVILNPLHEKSLTE